MDERRDVVVVGAGLAGLVCARGLSGAGVDVVVLEGADVIEHALPDMPAGTPLRRPIRVDGEGLYLCGDFRDTASIQGALVSGHRAAALVRTDPGGGA